MFEFLFHSLMGSNTDSSGASQIEVGSIGWEDEDDYFFLGDDSNDGHTLVRVQLFRGRDPTKPLSKTRAQGMKILCHLSGGLFRIPQKDTRVYVAIPKGMERLPGAGVIFATVEKSSPDGRLDKDRAVLDFGDEMHLVIKAKSVAIGDTAGNFIAAGAPRSGGPSGLTFQASDGTGGVIQEGVVSWFVASGGLAKSIIQMTPSKIECMHADGGCWIVDKDYYCLGTHATVQGGAVYLGAAPTVANFALWGVTGIAGVASPSVLISPI
jgi:hypothetical protein